MDDELTRIDPFAARWRADPFPLYRRFQAESPRHRFPSGPLLLTRYADCVAVLRDRRFGTDPRRQTRPTGEPPAATAFEGTPALPWTDPPDHTRLRRLAARAFTPRAVSSWRPLVGQIASELVDAMVARGGGDLLDEFAHPLPADVISAILGVPAHDRVVFREWSAAASRLVDGGLDQGALDAGVTAAGELFAYFSALVDQRRSASGDGMLDALIAAEESGDHLDEGELLSLIVTLFVAGHETTTHLITNAVAALCDHPGELARLWRDPGLAATATDECLRLVGPAQLALPRIASEPVTIGDECIERGETVLLAIAAANRDPARWHEPDRLDLGRDASGHLAFSTGIHHCLGASLARLECEIALHALVTRVGELTLTDAPRRWRAHAMIRGMEALPVTLTARRATRR